LPVCATASAVAPTFRARLSSAWPGAAAPITRAAQAGERFVPVVVRVDVIRVLGLSHVRRAVMAANPSGVAATPATQ